MNTHNCLHHSTLAEMLACYGSKAGENRALFDSLTILTSPIGTEVDSHFNLEHSGSYSLNILEAERENKTQRKGVKGGLREKNTGDGSSLDTINHRRRGRKEHVTIIRASLAPTRYRYRPVERANHAPASPCLYPCTQSGDGILIPLFFSPFSALPVVEGGGVGVTLTQFCHGRSHYRSDHFSLTHCKLQAG